MLPFHRCEVLVHWRCIPCRTIMGASAPAVGGEAPGCGQRAPCVRVRRLLGVLVLHLVFGSSVFSSSWLHLRGREQYVVQ